MFIDVDNGNLMIDGIILNSNTTKEKFIKCDLYQKVIKEKSNAFTNYFLSPQKIIDTIFSISLYFKGKNRLYMITLSALDNYSVPSWDQWSENDEMNTKIKHDKWLTNQIGTPPYKYTWGEISSEFDPRSASSMIVVRYY